MLARLQEGYLTDLRAYEAYIRGVIGLEERDYDKTAMAPTAERFSKFRDVCFRRDWLAIRVLRIIRLAY